MYSGKNPILASSSFNALASSDSTGDGVGFGFGSFGIFYSSSTNALITDIAGKTGDAIISLPFSGER